MTPKEAIGQAPVALAMKIQPIPVPAFLSEPAIELEPEPQMWDWLPEWTAEEAALAAVVSFIMAMMILVNILILVTFIRPFVN